MSWRQAKDANKLGKTQKLFRDLRFGITENQLKKFKPTKTHLEGGIKTADDFVDYVKKSDSYNRYKNRYAPDVGASKQALDLSEKLDDFLHAQYKANDADMLELVDLMDRGYDMDDFPYQDSWARLRTRFFKSQGYDGLVIKDAKLPQALGVKTLDDYFIAFNKESVTMIDDGRTNKRKIGSSNTLFFRGNFLRSYCMPLSPLKGTS